MCALANTESASDVQLNDVVLASERIYSYARRTPIIYSERLSNEFMEGTSVHLKLENLQEIGAFKVRGAAHAIQSLSDEDRKKGVTTFSTGNHGLAVAYVAKRMGIRAVICISNDVPSSKVAAILRTGAEIKRVGHSQDEAEALCRQLNEQQGLTIIKPFDHPHVIAGQGTIGLELLEDVPQLDTVVVPLSGGGLIAGIALVMKSSGRDIRVVGVSMERGAAMYESIRLGEPTLVEETETLADSLRGGIGLDNRYTFPMVQSLVDEIVLVPEAEIRHGMQFMLKEHGMVVEGAAATGIGAILNKQIRNFGKHAVVIISGKNVDEGVLQRLVRG
ncbi:hydroxyectoine utilization dehydratase EutB [Alicyclobacillus fastidiosus]|uniref:Hydroxyectoine utilization dehydratase EutB n=1 Tax=Alicyclobacillus fastidiosus TaxID=392011 RepID=A0ABV5AAF8_9BACL|nr:hydroxyectoine utilization dehydratase EutB [Alicyclobacillus fastidiosus]WEH07668.1 hydroxyectoine utilization dehydratase EutB [Alicyclobacillus fastidiosus]